MRISRDLRPPIRSSLGIVGLLAFISAPVLAEGVQAAPLRDAADKPTIQLPADPTSTVLEVWIGGGLEAQNTKITIKADGAVRVADPKRDSEDIGSYHLQLTDDELHALLRGLAEADLFEVSTSELRASLDAQMREHGEERTVTDAVNYLVLASFDSYQRSGTKEPIAAFAHTIRIPHLGFHVRRLPHVKKVQDLARAIGAVTSLTEDERLTRTYEQQ